MLGFGPVAAITPAGSPLGAAVAYDWFLDGAVLVIEDQPTNLQYNVPLDADTGVLMVRGSPLNAIADYILAAESSTYWLLGKPARVFVSVFSYTDTEMIRVPVEVRMMYVPNEQKHMYVRPVPDDTLVTNEDEMTAPPRLRRT